MSNTSRYYRSSDKSIKPRLQKTVARYQAGGTKKSGSLQHVNNGSSTRIEKQAQDGATDS
jgi:hypothetical protein